MPEVKVEMVTISKRQYDTLLYNQRFLAALESGGVDNWEWYGEAYQEFIKEYPEYGDE